MSAYNITFFFPPFINAEIEMHNKSLLKRRDHFNVAIGLWILLNVYMAAVRFD